MSLFRSNRTQARVVFGVFTAAAVAVSLMFLDVAPRFGPLVEEVAIVPLFLTAWIGAAVYRRRFAGHYWQLRMAIVMAASGAAGGIVALAALMSWNEWPSLGAVALWGSALVVGSALFGVSTVPLMWLGDRRLLRIKLKRRHRTAVTFPPTSPPDDQSAKAPAPPTSGE